MSGKTTSAEKKFTGKDSGLTFDRFDEKVVSWGRLKYGEKYAKSLWRNELVDLNSLDLKDDLGRWQLCGSSSFAGLGQANRRKLRNVKISTWLMPNDN